MSQGPSVAPSGALAGGSASVSEFHASSSPAPGGASKPAAKLRSCVVCRSRKVRCDKQSPCSNCRRANIACVVSANDRPPRWARRLERITNNAAAPDAPVEGSGQVMDRLRNLEGLVKELSGQLEQANAAAASAAGGSSGVNSPGSSAHERESDHRGASSSPANAAGIQKHFGRMVLQDTTRSRYIGSGFWSRVSDELEGLKMDTRRLATGDSDTSEDEDEDSPGKTSSTRELDRSPPQRHAFLFGHNLGTSRPDSRDFRPLPSQVPFLISTYSENVNLFLGIVHIPTVNKMVRDMRGTDMSSLTPANEALLFSIYYAAVTSMEEDDVMTNFGSTKAELNLKFRLGLEHALAKADFLSAPNVVLVQAFTLFLFLARRHDSPRFVWMMVGLAIRMAQAVGLQRDGSQFDNLTPFEVEMRRRLWWALCVLDIRASEDQGTEYTIPSGSFDTRLPLNINDSDIDTDTKQMPPERHHVVADVTFALVTFQMTETVREMMAPGANGGGPGLDEQSRLLSGLYQKLDEGYLQHATDTGNIAYWVGLVATRLVISKLTLLIYLPALFASSSERFSDEVQGKLLVAAIEVAEYNHALNAEEKARQWRWIYQTYTHWHSIVYLLLEVTRRRWSPIVERAWIALHSSWLMPAQPNLDENGQLWLPLRKLMAKARKHREAELKRLQGDDQAIRQLEEEDRKIPVPASGGPFPADKSEELFREHWRGLVTLPGQPSSQAPYSTTPELSTSRSPSAAPLVDAPQNLSPGAGYGQHGGWSNTGFEPVYQTGGSHLGSQSPPNSNTNPASAMPMGGLTPEQIEQASQSALPTVPLDWSGDQSIGPGFTPWLWFDADPPVQDVAGVDVSMDLDEDVNWNNWLQSATGMELNTRPEGAADNWTAPM